MGECAYIRVGIYIHVCTYTYVYNIYMKDHSRRKRYDSHVRQTCLKIDFEHPNIFVTEFVSKSLDIT